MIVGWVAGRRGWAAVRVAAKALFSALRGRGLLTLLLLRSAKVVVDTGMGLLVGAGRV
jgi:hypothetical protein